jgi:PKD repeat protein
MTTVCQSQAVTFTDDSFDNITSRTWEFQGGTPAFSNELSPEVRYYTTGKYDVKLTVSDGVKTRTILKQKYIQVDHCSGAEEPPAASSLFRLFPNPASEQVTIEINRNISGNCKLTLFDLTGCRVMEVSQSIPAGNHFSMNISALSKGIYFLRVQAGELMSTLKVVRN